MLSTKWNSSPYTFNKLARVKAIDSLLFWQIWILLKRFLIATYSQMYEWIQLILVSIASLCQQLNLALRLWRRKPASCVPLSVFPIIYNFKFVYQRIENNTGISMCAVMITRKTPILQTNVIVSYVQEFVDSSISFILFLIKCTHCEFSSLFSLETKPSLVEGNCEINKLLRKICLMIFQTWFNELFMFCFLQVALWWKSTEVKDQLYSRKRMARFVSLISEVLEWPYSALPWDS